MSDENTQEDGATLIDPTNAMGAFAAVMDTIAAEKDSAESTEGGEALQADATATGLSTATNEAAGSEASSVGTPDAGAAGSQGLPAGSEAAGGSGGDQGSFGSATGFEVAEVIPKFTEITSKLEQNLTESLTNEAFGEVQTEYEQYFNALKQHPRQLVGTEVPSLTGEGMETLRDSADAAEWQEAVKSLLSQEVSSRAEAKQGELAGTFETIHASVDLFKNNHDLIPGAKGFDKQLADEFATLAKDYEIRGEDGKLIGWAVPVQPLINNLRTQLQVRRSAAAMPVAGSTQAASVAAKPAPKPAAAPVVDAPQAGVVSSAGAVNRDSASDFSTLFGTLGLPDLVI